MAVCAALSFVACSGQKETSEQVEEDTVQLVKIAKVMEQAVPQVVSYTATVEPYKRNSISSSVPNRIKKIYVEVGDKVYAGQKLVDLDQANLAQQKLQLDNLELEYNRVKELFAVGGASQQQVDQLRTQYETTKTAYGNLDENTVLVSPVNGVVTARNFDNGDMASGAILTVMQIQPVKVLVKVSESDFTKGKIGMSVDVNVEEYGDEVSKGKVSLIHPTIDPAARTFVTEINIPNPDSRIRPGMFGGEKMQHIGMLTDGTVVIVTRRNGVGPVFRYPTDFWGFLRTANKPKKLEWREYKEVYPNLPIFLPPKATERKIILKKDSLTILGSVFTPPFTLSQLAEKLGPARIVLQNGTRKSPMTGRESPYTQALALWDELGLQGWLDEDEQTIKTIGVRVAAQGEYAVRQTFDGAVWIGSKDYREASWKDFAGFAHTLKLGGFTVYTRLPGPVSEEQSAQKAKLEALSAMVQISWKEPEQKAAKAQKYKLSKPTEPVLTFTSFNFKLAVMEVLMYEKGLLAPKLDAHEFAREYSRRKIDIDAEGYEPIPEIRKWLEKYPVPERLAPEVTEIEMDGGSEIYTQLCPFWDGEDGAFDLNTITEAELRQFPNLKHITLMSSKPEQVLPVLERCGIKVDLL